ncbi:uncharacterized protein LOC124301030 isoform X1 [Neodiprion virginianus]|uniref:uncharacterized protein LOC124177986 isoform X1 n=1 Tax=Neodiprion fabricii TaxID=2872261 RepID=UPI001ED94D10|nr:uncharacterized protein LOC124177986 isoform X1 [Neodiprion fabricii]XP_046611623.1 uncharacterized protein LOC124301030 isoform X1 [Neodiprion virginianus]
MLQKAVIALVLSSCMIGLCVCIPTRIAGDLAILRLCNASSTVSLDTVNSVLIHRDMHHSQAKTDALKCFLLCIYVEYGWMDRDGGFELHSIRSALQAAQVPQDRIEMLSYGCTAIESSSPCNRASIFTECFWLHTENGLQEATAGPAMK